MRRKAFLCKGIILLLIAAAVLFFLEFPLYSADSLSKRRGELEQIQRRLQEERSRLRKVKREQRRVLDEVEQLDRAMERNEIRLKLLQRQLRQVQARIQATGTKLTISEGRLRRQRQALGMRLRQIYQWGRVGYLDLLLGSRDFGEFVTHYTYLGLIVRRDGELIQDLVEETQRWRELRAQLASQQEELQGLISQVQREQRALEQEAERKRQLLAEIAQKRALYEQVVEDLERESKELEELIRQIQAGSRRFGVISRGALLWPLEGEITSGFGVRRHPIFRIAKMHTGVDIASTWGTPVPAAGDGEVIYAGWFGGYGKIVVIDHGGGLSTLYAHLSTILVELGQKVKRGQIIGRVGSTGYSTGPHLHFEIRIDGRPVDPLAP
ncbi:MAG: peptidoglycan DD-metalloendopeptidase family protein [Armatimonadota bacterium]|nr:peptidoglycan DD-metalloendopeptidase family protein [Armatimonadota bacterium]